MHCELYEGGNDYGNEGGNEGDDEGSDEGTDKGGNKGGIEGEGFCFQTYAQTFVILESLLQLKTCLDKVTRAFGGLKLIDE